MLKSTSLFPAPYLNQSHFLTFLQLKSVHKSPKFMIKPFSVFRLITFFALFVAPSLLCANGELTGNPMNGRPVNTDSTSSMQGHCIPTTLAEINCVTHTIELSAWITYIFTGQLEPQVVTWSTGQIGHKITVSSPGTWSWDASATGCEPNHWDNNIYNQSGSFFLGTLDILGQPLCQNGTVNLTVFPPDNIYSFANYSWNPPNVQSGPSQFEVTEPGVYLLTVTDQLGCTFTDQINIPQSPPVNPTLSGPISMSPSGDTGVIMVNQPWSAYLWSTGQTTNSITVTEPGIYEVTVTNQFGCTGVGIIGIQQVTPDPWTVVPTSRNHTIIIPDSLKFDPLGGSLQVGDHIGVFYDSAATGTLKCGGYAVWSGLTLVFAAYGNDAAPLPQNGFNSGEVFKVKYWRNATNQAFDAGVSYAPPGSFAGLITHTNTFADDGISMIMSLTTAVKHAIVIEAGWNMISSYIKPTQLNMKEVFEPIAPSIDIVKNGAGVSYIPLLNINSIGNWNILEGYQVKANQKDTLLVIGQKIEPEANPIPLKAGWQIIGYLRENPMNIDTAFKLIKTHISLVKNNDGKIYSPQFGINTIGNMIPGQGYKVKALSNVVLSYRPNLTSQPIAERTENNLEFETPHFVLDSNLNTGNNAILILTDSIAKSVIGSGDEIGVFTPAGVLCGAATYQQGENVAITVWGDDPSTNGIFEGLRVDSAYQFRVWDSSEEKECKASTTFQSGINAYMVDAIEIIQSMMLSLPSDTTIVEAACESYILNGETYLSSGIYTQILPNFAGCDSTITLNLTINPIPTVTVDGSNICLGDTATLTANGADTYLWSNGATTNSIFVSPNTTSNFIVTGTTTGCNSAPAIIEVIVTTYPILTVNSETICLDQSAVLTAIGAENYVWSTGEITNAITVSPNSTSTYTVIGTTEGCSSTSESLVTVDLISVDLGTTISLPIGDSVILNAACDCQSYQWSTGETTSMISVFLEGNYTVTVTTSTGCTATDNVIILTTSSNDLIKAHKLTILPNPATDAIFVTCTGASISSIQILGNLGQIVLTEIFDMPAGMTHPISLKGLPPGIYYMKVVSEGFMQTTTVIKE